jgi:hypothetical protein
MPSSINQVYFENGIFVDYVGNPLPLGIAGGAGVTGPTGPEGPTGEIGSGATSISLYQARKYVKKKRGMAQESTIPLVDLYRRGAVRVCSTWPSPSPSSWAC